MKKILFFFFFGVRSAVFLFAQQTPNPEWLFSFQNKDTVLSREQIHFWGKSGQFPAYLDWKNSAYAICPSQIDGVGLFTDSLSSFAAGQDVGWAFIKVASTGTFIDDYYETNSGKFVNDSQTPNVEIISTQQGLLMRAIVNIYPNTEIVARYQDILDIFPGDKTAEFLIRYW